MEVKAQTYAAETLAPCSLIDKRAFLTKAQGKVTRRHVTCHMIYARGTLGTINSM